MKSKKLLTALGLGALSLTVLGTNLISSAAAANVSDAGVQDQNNFGQMGQGPQEQGGEYAQGGEQNHQGRPQLKNVKKTVTNLENGVQVTCTSDDADTVKALQSMKHPDAPKDAPADITVVHSNIANGIQVTITSTNADTVKKIQEHEKNGGGPGMGQGGQNGQRGPNFDSSKVKTAAANLANGATITLTSDDSATVSKIQDFAKNFRLPPNGRPEMSKGMGREMGPRMGGQGRQGQNGGQQDGPQGAQGQQGGPQGDQPQA